MLLLAVSLLLFVDEEKSRLEEKHDADDSGEEDKGRNNMFIVKEFGTIVDSHSAARLIIISLLLLLTC